MKEYVITRKLSTLFGVLAEYFSAFWQNVFRRFGRSYQTFSAAFNIIFIDVYLLTVIVVILVVKRHLYTKEKS